MQPSSGNTHEHNHLGFWAALNIIMKQKERFSNDQSKSYRPKVGWLMDAFTTKRAYRSVTVRNLRVENAIPIFTYVYCLYSLITNRRGKRVLVEKLTDKYTVLKKALHYLLFYFLLYNIISYYIILCYIILSSLHKYKLQTVVKLKVGIITTSNLYQSIKLITIILKCCFSLLVII